MSMKNAEKLLKCIPVITGVYTHKICLFGQRNEQALSNFEP